MASNSRSEIPSSAEAVLGMADHGHISEARDVSVVVLHGLLPDAPALRSFSSMLPQEPLVSLAARPHGVGSERMAGTSACISTFMTDATRPSSTNILQQVGPLRYLRPPVQLRTAAPGAQDGHARQPLSALSSRVSVLGSIPRRLTTFRR